MNVAEDLWRKVSRFVAPLRFCPFLEMVAVGNTLAFGVADGESDIDLFVVAKQGRIFLVRTFLTIYFQLLGVRRYGGKVAGRFCLSFFVTDDALNLDDIRLDDEDFYMLFWVLTLQPVIGGATYKRFVEENSWVTIYGPVDFADCERLIKRSSFASRLKFLLEVFANLLVVWWLEPLLAQWQIKRARRKAVAMKCGLKHVVISKKMLKFHDKDARKVINQKFLAKMSKLQVR